MLGKSKKKPISNPNDYLVALDIGTEFTKALIARVGKKGLLEIIGAGRAKQEVGNMYSGAIADITGVVRSCEDALVQAEDMAGLQTKNVVIGIAGEFVKGLTSTVRYRRPKPEKELDAHEVEFIIQKAQERSAEKARRQIVAETGSPDVEIKLVNSAIVSLRIDGYKVTNPLGFQGKDVLIQIYTAFAPMVHVGALERIANELDLDLLAVAAEPFAVARAILGSDASNNYTAILIDIGGGSTDIAVVNDGGVEGTRMFGIAGRSFTKAIANDLGIDHDKAEKLKLHIDDPKLRPAAKKAVDEIVEKVLSVWEQGIELSLDDFESVDHLPNRILLCGGGSALDALVERLALGNWYRELPFTKRPTIQHIALDDVLDIADTTGKVKDYTMMTAMGLLRVGYDTLIGNDAPDNVNDKINRFLRI